MTASRLRVGLAALTLAACRAGGAAPSGAATQSGSESVDLVEIFRQSLCGPGQYFAQCGRYDASRDCWAIAREVTERCLEEQPEILESAFAAGYMALGYCASGGMFAVLKSEQRLNLEGKCGQPDSFR